MRPEVTLTRQRLTTPRAAAVAGILFSILLIITVMLAAGYDGLTAGALILLGAGI